MTYNVFSGTLNPAQSVSQPTVTQNPIFSTISGLAAAETIFNSMNNRIVSVIHRVTVT